MTEAKPLYFIPAAPGFFALELVGDDDPDSTFGIWRYPIVAWELRLCNEDKPERGYFAVPVTPEWEDIATYVEMTPILGPDGRVTVAGAANYDSEEKWFEAAKAAARPRARRGEKA